VGVGGRRTGRVIRAYAAGSLAARFLVPGTIACVADPDQASAYGSDARSAAHREVDVNLHLTDEFIRSILSTERLDAAQVNAIVRMAYLAAEIDFTEDTAERATLVGLGEQLSRIAQVPVQSIAPISPLPIDDEERRARIREIGLDLTTRSARELAYVVAYLLAVSDVELAPVETRFLEDLQAALDIEDDRAAELAATAASAATPGVDQAT
jgi:hypothetical protein